MVKRQENYFAGEVLRQFDVRSSSCLPMPERHEAELETCNQLTIILVVIINIV